MADEITSSDLAVIGEIPRDINGVYLSNGPNRQYPADDRDYFVRARLGGWLSCDHSDDHAP